VLLTDLADVLGVIAGEDDREEDAAAGRPVSSRLFLGVFSLGFVDVPEAQKEAEMAFLIGGPVGEM
jgi:hypothetical protein